MSETLATSYKFIDELSRNGVVEISYKCGNTVHAYTTARQLDVHITQKYGSWDYLRWTMQRPIDQKKVDNIIEVEKNQIRRFGCITSTFACQISTISGEFPKLTDGQHRFVALRTEEEGVLARQRILIIFTDFPSEEDRFIYFKNINENTPVPSIYKEHVGNFFRCIAINCGDSIDAWIKTEKIEISRFQSETGVRVEGSKIKQRLLEMCDRYTKMGIIIKEEFSTQFVRELIALNNKLKDHPISDYPKFVSNPNTCSHSKKKGSGFQCTSPQTVGDRCGNHCYSTCKKCSIGEKCDNDDHKKISTRLIRESTFALIGRTLPIFMFQDYKWIDEVFKHMYSSLL